MNTWSYFIFFIIKPYINVFLNSLNQVIHNIWGNCFPCLYIKLEPTVLSRTRKKKSHAFLRDHRQNTILAKFMKQLRQRISFLLLGFI